MLYKISEAGKMPSFVISQSDAFFALAGALVLFGLVSFIIVYHLSVYSISEMASRKIQLFYLLVSGVIILAAAGTIFFL